MTINEMIAIHKEMTTLVAKTPIAEVSAAKMELETASGYKATIAQAKLRDAETALADHESAMAALKSQLPTDEASATRIWFAERYAAYETKREARMAEVAALEVQLEEALEEAKKGAWKWAKAAANQVKETSSVTSIRAQIADVKKLIDLLDAENATIKNVIDESRRADERNAELDAWLAGGPKPEYLRIRDEAEQEAFLRECTVLKLPKRGEPYYNFRFYEGPEPEPEPEVEVEVEEPSDWGHAMTIEQYLQSLMPPPVVEKEEVFKPSTRGGTPAWIKRHVAARKARLAAANPSLVVTEVS